MKIRCLTCRHTITLNRHASESYFGALKCYYCKSMMDVKIRHGILLDASCLLSDFSHALRRRTTVRQVSSYGASP